VRRNTIPNTIGIQIGDSTHNHDHSMKFVSFKPMNNIVNKPKKPIPPEIELELDIFALLLIVFIIISYKNLI